MNTFGRIAYRYANSVLLLAKTEGHLEAVAADMANFVSLNKASKDLSLMLASPIIPHFTKLAILKKIFEGRVNPLTFSLFEILVKKKREAALPEIAVSFVEQYERMKGIKRAFVTSAIPLTDALRAQFIEVAKKESGSEHITLIEQVDASVIGGFKLLIGDKQIDETVSSKLAELKLKLIDQSYIAKL